MITEKDVFGAMLDAAEAKAKNVENSRVRSKQFGMPNHPTNEFDRNSKIFTEVAIEAWNAGGKAYEEEHPGFVFGLGLSDSCVDDEEIESYEECYEAYYEDAIHCCEELDDEWSK